METEETLKYSKSDKLINNFEQEYEPEKEG